MFSSTHGSQCDSEYNYIPGYIIEDESNDTSHEIGNLEAVDSEILGDYFWLFSSYRADVSWRAPKSLLKIL